MKIYKIVYGTEKSNRASSVMELLPSVEPGKEKSLLLPETIRGTLRENSPEKKGFLVAKGT